MVNGSSELVGHIDVSESGERGFENIGAIDISLVREVITSTMEGGEKAFKDRQDNMVTETNLTNDGLLTLVVPINEFQINHFEVIEMKVNK